MRSSIRSFPTCCVALVQDLLHAQRHFRQLELRFSCRSGGFRRCRGAYCLWATPGPQRNPEIWFRRRYPPATATQTFGVTASTADSSTPPTAPFTAQYTRVDQPGSIETAAARGQTRAPALDTDGDSDAVAEVATAVAIGSRTEVR